MKILVISHEYPPIGGGGANACSYLTRGFAEHGHKVTIVTANYNGLPEREAILGVQIIRVNAKRKHQEHCSFQEMLSFLMKALPVADQLQKKERFDICQIFFGIPSGPVGFYLKKKYHLPYVIRFGGGDIPGFQERFAKVYRMIAPAVRLIWKNADTLVANSEGLQQLAYRFYDKKEVKIITNGVDTEYFVPGDKKGKVIKILFVSRLIERKGLQHIIPKLSEIQEKSGQQIRLIIVGDGPYKEELIRITAESDAQDMVCFEGYKNKRDILAYYQDADIFILPSRKEGMPNVVLEAMACGLPIVMTPCEGSRELITDNGYIAEISDFSQYVITLCLDSELRKKMGENSRVRAEKVFAWSTIVDAYMMEFDRIRIKSEE